MKLLVTGAAGFIGMHCAKRLLERGDEVLGIDNLSPYYPVELKKARLKRLEHDRFRFVHMDLVDAESLIKTFEREKPGAVLHDAKEIARRVVRMVQEGAVVSVTGKVIKMRTDTVCIHGDTPGAVDIARGVRQALKDVGIAVAPFKVN